VIFLPQKVVSSWDTWIFWNEGVYYLYYLAGAMGHWDGFGLAVSMDGVNFTDHGQVLFASDEMTLYLGTGSVWRSPLCGEAEVFYCNYSEGRKCPDGSKEQRIFFAKSKDLRSWTKMDKITEFVCDRRWYVSDDAEGGRWDCIFTLPKPGGGLYGYFTAKPKEYTGFGMAESDDGCHWSALPPPRLELADCGLEIDIRDVELGAVTEYDGRYYCLLGIGPGLAGMVVAVGHTPAGPFYPQTENFFLQTNKYSSNAYFMRFFETPEGLFVNHHSVAREKSALGYEKIYLAPIKKVEFDPDGILWLRWWSSNELLKGREINDFSGKLQHNGFIIEALFEQEASLRLNLQNGDLFIISVDAGGTVRYLHEQADGNVYEKESCRWVSRSSKSHLIRLLVRESLTELYICDNFINDVTAPDSCRAFSGGGGISDIRLWELNC